MRTRLQTTSAQDHQAYVKRQVTSPLPPVQNTAESGNRAQSTGPYVRTGTSQVICSVSLLHSSKTKNKKSCQACKRLKRGRGPSGCLFCIISRHPKNKNGVTLYNNSNNNNRDVGEPRARNKHKALCGLTHAFKNTCKKFEQHYYCTTIATIPSSVVRTRSIQSEN